MALNDPLQTLGLFASAQELAQAEQAAQTAQSEVEESLAWRLAALTTLAWHLRQRDGERALTLGAQVQTLMAAEAAEPQLQQRCLARLALITGEIALLQNDILRAEQCQVQAESGFAQAADQIGQGDALWLRSSILAEQGAMAQFHPVMAQVAEVYRQAGDPNRVRVAQAKNWSLLAFRDAQAAAVGLQRDLGQLSECDEATLAWVESALATIAAQADQLGESIKHDLQAHRLAGGSGQVRLAAIGASNASEGFLTLGDLDAALEWAERGLSVARSRGWPTLIALCERQTADVLRLLDRPEQASPLLIKAAAAVQGMGPSRNKGEVIHSLGRLQMESGQLDAALKSFSQLEHDVTASGHADLMIKAWRGLAGVLSRQGQHQAATRKALRALGLARERGNADDQIQTLMVLAEVHQAAHHADHRPPGTLAVAPAAADERNDQHSALDFLRQALQLAESVPGYSVSRELLRRLAAACAETGDFESAYRHSLAAEEAFSHSRVRDAQNRALALEIRRDVESARADTERHRKLAATLQATADTLETLGMMGREITASLDAQAVCRSLHKHLSELLDVSFFLVYVLDSEGQHLRNLLPRDLDDHPGIAVVGLDNKQSFLATAARERREIFIDRDLAQAASGHIPGTLPSLSLLFFPLEVGGRLLGAMSVQSTRSHAYGERERAIFRTLCAWGAIGLDNAATYSAAAQQKQELRVAAVAFESQEAMMVTDARHSILRVNSACTRITGYSAEALIGEHPALFRSGPGDIGTPAAVQAALDAQDQWSGELTIHRLDGSELPLWLSVTAVRNRDDEITHYVYAASDITARKHAEQEIRSLAFYDSLTGLPNRRLLMDRLEHGRLTSERTESAGAVLFIDLDKFKTLNDTRGHDVGDLLLAQVAQRLLGCLREGDTVARWGGDEFAVLLENLGPNEREAAERVEGVARKILHELNQVYLLQGQDHHSSPSIGVSTFKGRSLSAEDLLKQADLAMYQAKSAGRNTVRFYDPAMQAAVNAHAQLELDLRAALQGGQFQLHYQPQMGGDGQLIGAEALVRWQHPLRGLVSPLEFIPAAEETGLILPLGLWVLETACHQLQRWAAAPVTAALSLAVNISARQFHDPRFVPQVLELLQQTGIDPHRLKLEVTESLLLENIDSIIDKMRRLMECGVRFSLDDFGTGYSSLSYLKRLPLEQLKIDRSFVRDIFEDENDVVIVRTIVKLGQSLGLQVIAEGVESVAQWRFLEGIGCQAFQGYLFGRPVPIEQFSSDHIRP
jgi:diguanylate cyclase (GGDEF)-like protein/PAS domain S-box-containing protein